MFGNVWPTQFFHPRINVDCQCWRNPSCQDDARDSQTKAFSKMKGFKGDEKAWPDWQYKFRVEAARSFRQSAAILDWADDLYDQPISESDIQRVAAKENWVDMTNFNMRSGFPQRRAR